LWDASRLVRWHLSWRAAAHAANAAERAIIILDGSGSMWAQIDGEARISIARETLGEVLDSVPADLELGFMTYGTARRASAATSSFWSSRRPAPPTRSAKAADGITPLGKTPISDAVRLAAEDLATPRTRRR
jgi:Ca-activated chloride channel family protein